jgi:hypothetical protein
MLTGRGLPAGPGLIRPVAIALRLCRRSASRTLPGRAQRIREVL